MGGGEGRLAATAKHRVLGLQGPHVEGEVLLDLGLAGVLGHPGKGAGAGQGLGWAVCGMLRSAGLGWSSLLMSSC